MNIRIVNQGTATVYAELRHVASVEIPEKSTTIYVNGEDYYVRQVIKSYESKDGGPASTWFVIEV